MPKSGESKRTPEEFPFPFDETTYAELCHRIAEARAQGQDFELRGAKQIALYVKRSEAYWRWVFRQRWLPIHREGNRICMYVDVYETFLDVRRYCALHALNLHQELRRRGIYEPKAPKRS